MDLSPFKQDIDELIEDFAEVESTSFADMKRIWLVRKFSFIYEARPSANLGFFMQSLYAHAIGHMFATASLSRRLGGLYCLYCLHETQPFKPPFRIYLSVEELKKLRCLIVDAKDDGIFVASALVERMLQRNMFLFGYVEVNEGCGQERVNELSVMQKAQIQVAHKKLLQDTPMERFLHLDMGMELDLQGLKKLSTEYAKAKEVAIMEATEVVDLQDIRHISENQTSIGDVVGKIAEDWNVEKQAFNQRTGFCEHPPAKERPQHPEDDEAFRKELDLLLSQT